MTPPLESPMSELMRFDAEVYFEESHPYAKPAEVYIAKAVDIVLAAQDETLETLRRDKAELAGALERLRAAQTWQPIDTAPRDRDVLLWWEYWSKRPTIGRWKHDRWIAEDALVDLTTSNAMDNPPTHWMPLPSAPERS